MISKGLQGNDFCLHYALSVQSAQLSKTLCFKLLPRGYSARLADEHTTAATVVGDHTGGALDTRYDSRVHGATDWFPMGSKQRVL